MSGLISNRYCFGIIIVLLVVVCCCDNLLNIEILALFKEENIIVIVASFLLDYMRRRLWIKNGSICEGLK